MAMTINTNVVSINAQRNLGLSGNSLGTTMQRLSSGLRVNSAKDDAAGLAIAERMSSQSRGLVVASRNANDGISLAQTAEGALGKVGDMLQRMRELAVQSSNATNSKSDREALQAEVTQLRSEIDRVAKTSAFNGKNLLDGTFAGGVFQVGAAAGDNITVGGITNAKASNLSSISYGTDSMKIDLEGLAVTASVISVNATTGATTTASGTTKLEVLSEYAEKISGNTLKLSVGGAQAIDLGEIAAASSKTERLGQVVAAINAHTADTGVTAFLENNSDGTFQLSLMSSAVDGNNDPKTVALTGFTLSNSGFLSEIESRPDGTTATPTWNSTANGDYDDAVAGSALEAKVAFLKEVDDENQRVAMVALKALQGDPAQLLATTLGITADAAQSISNESGMNGLDISTQSGAWKALKKIDSAIDQVNAARADLGALQTRFEKSIENIDIMNENISAARGRIVDADFAQETANLSRSQILQQAGTAMVAQANQLPQGVLSLLQ
jgi:flagellin